MNALIAMTRKVFGLFVDDGSLTLAILVWILMLHFVVQILPIEHAWAALILFLGCLWILIENVLRTSRDH